MKQRLKNMDRVLQKMSLVTIGIIMIYSFSVPILTRH